MRENVAVPLRWVPVVDGSGRRRLEMRWELPAVAERQPARRAA